MNQTFEAAWAALGLSAVDRAIYLEILRGAADEATLATAMGQDSEAVPASLGRLREAGLVGSGADAGVVAGQPLMTLRRASARLQMLAGELLEDSVQLQALHVRDTEDERGGPVLRVMTTLPDVQRVFAEVLAGAEHQVLAFVKPPFFATGDFSSDEHQQLERGVTYRVVYDPQAVEAMGGPQELAGFVRAGEQARISDSLPLKMFVVDGRHALLPMDGLADGPADGPAEEARAVLVTGSGVVTALVALFESVWQDAWDLTDPPLPEGLALDERDRLIVAALRHGATDDAIARRLGVTTRTIGRRVARLLEITHAATRFQLGWRLSERVEQGSRPEG